MALISAGAAHGAEKIRYEEIPARIAPFGVTIQSFGVKVTTVDGVVHKGRTLVAYATGLELDARQIPGPEVARIEIRRGRRALDFTLDSLGIAVFVGYACFAPGGGDACFLIPFVVPGGLACAAASAPVTLAIDGVELLIPPKVYEIVH